MEKNRLYVLTRNDLNLPYQGVQAGHAVAQWMLENKDKEVWNNEYLIYLEVDNIDFWKMKLSDKGINYSEFKEPDLNNLTTAIAINHNGNLFRNLKKLGA